MPVLKNKKKISERATLTQVMPWSKRNRLNSRWCAQAWKTNSRVANARKCWFDRPRSCCSTIQLDNYSAEPEGDIAQTGGVPFCGMSTGCDFNSARWILCLFCSPPHLKRNALPTHITFCARVWTVSFSDDTAEFTIGLQKLYFEIWIAGIWKIWIC